MRSLAGSLDSPECTSNDRRMSLASIQNEIEKLKPAERAALIDVLWESLDEERIKEIETKWAAESALTLPVLTMIV